MRLHRLFRTTAVRLAARYVLLYALVLGAALAALWWSTGQYVDAKLEAGLERQLAALEREYGNGGIAGLAIAVGRLAVDAREQDRLYLLMAANGKKMAGNLLAWPEEAPLANDGPIESIWIEEGIVPGRLQDESYAPVITRQFPDGSRLLLGHNGEQLDALQEIAEYLLEVLGAAVLLALVMGITLGRAILRRMDTIGRTAGEIMAGDLSQRVPASGHNDEFDTLAGRLNAMLDRIQQLIKGIREVSDNVAHDLRSPLTRLRNRLEVTLLEERSKEQYRQAIGQSLGDVDALIKTFNALLGIAQAEAGNHRNQWVSVQLDRLVCDLVDLYRPVAEQQGQTLEKDTCGDTEIIGSRQLLAQVIGNLLENAIKYTPEGGSITLRVRPSGDSVEVMVADTGPGIPESERAHVLERFVRLEGSRHTPGNGLGLSLVDAVSKLHNAQLSMGDAGPGLVVSIRFPKHQEEKKVR